MCACVEHGCVGVHYCARVCVGVGGVCMCGWVGVCMHVCGVHACVCGCEDMETSAPDVI